MTTPSTQSVRERIADEIRTLQLIPSPEAVKEGAMNWEQIVEYKTTRLLALYKEMAGEVIGEEIDYEKYGKCPSCSAGYMYQCSCDSGSLYTVNQQRQRLAEQVVRERIVS